MTGPLDERLMDVYRRLLACYGPQSWWPGDSPFEVIVGAILTQSAAWTGVERAHRQPQGRRSAVAGRPPRRPIEELAVLIRPSVYFNAKSRKLRAFVEHLGEHYDDDLDAMFRQDVDALRRELLSIHGIGEETADDILLYAAGKPVFVIDAYTRRIWAGSGSRRRSSGTGRTSRCSWTTCLVTRACSTSTTRCWTGTAWRPAASGRRFASRAACWPCARRARRLSVRT